MGPRPPRCESASCVAADDAASASTSHRAFEIDAAAAMSEPSAGKDTHTSASANCEPSSGSTCDKRTRGSLGVLSGGGGTHSSWSADEAAVGSTRGGGVSVIVGVSVSVSVSVNGTHLQLREPLVEHLEHVVLLDAQPRREHDHGGVPVNVNVNVNVRRRPPRCPAALRA